MNERILAISWLEGYIEEFDATKFQKMFGLYNRDRQARVDRAKKKLEELTLNPEQVETNGNIITENNNDQINLDSNCNANKREC